MEKLDLMTEVAAYNEQNGKWYRNSELDLTVQLNANGEVQAFQLDYQEKHKNYSLTWNDFKLKDYVIDEGESDPRKNQTPIILGEREKHSAQLLEHFAKVSIRLPWQIRDFILEKLKRESPTPVS